MTNRELASYFDISPAAFSLIINNKPGVSDKTRERVLSELEKMGYGNLIKKEQSRTQNESLCFIIFKRHGEILDQHPFFLLLMENIEQRARRYGYQMLVSTIDRRLPLNEQIQYLNSIDVQGAIIFATEMQEEDIECFREFHKPFIILDNDFSTLPINTISINNQMGTYLAIEYLLKMGHREIGYLQGSSRISSFKERKRGYRAAMDSFGLELKSEYVFKIRYSEEGSYQDFRQILKNGVKLPTAFVSDDDTITLGVMKALLEQGIRVPEDISLVGYNDRPICEITHPRLTTVNVSRYSFAVEAVDALVGIIRVRENGESELRTKKLRIATSLSIRDSVKRINNADMLEKEE